MRATLLASALVIGVAFGLLLSALPVKAASGPDWGNPQVIETSAWGYCYNPQVAMDSSGNAIVVWEQEDGSYRNLNSKRYVVGNGWQATELAEMDAGYANEPQLAVDDEGNAVVVWMMAESVPPYRCDVWANRYVIGAGWGAAGPIETDVNDGIRGPQVGVDGEGNAIAVWERYNGSSDSHIWSNRYAAGAGWGLAERIDLEDKVSRDPQIAVDSVGNAVVVWWDMSRDVWSNRYVIGTGWGTAQQIETSHDECTYPQVVVDGSGNAIAVWSSGNTGVMSNRYEVGMGWGTELPICNRSLGTTGYPQVAVDGLGNAIAVWVRNNDTSHSIWSNRYVLETGWGTAQLVGTNNSVNVTHLQVGVDNRGNAIAVWGQPNGVNGSIWSSRYVAGTGWETSQLVSADNAEYAGYPQVAVDVPGNAIAVWMGGSSETHDSILSNRFTVSEESSEFPLVAVGLVVVAAVAAVAALSYVYVRRRQPPKEQQQAQPPVS